MKYFIIAIIIIAIGAGVWFGFFSGRAPQSGAPAENSTTPMANDTSSPAPAPSETATSTTAVLETSYGNIEITLDPASAPLTSANFEKLVRDGFYNNLTFHRIIPGFVIQGGDPSGDGTGGPGYTIPAEIKLPHKRGSIATARTGDQVNPTRASSGSQFYIVLADNVGPGGLDGQYTVFGQVTAGMDAVDKIARVKTGSNDKPLEPVIIKKAHVK